MRTNVVDDLLDVDPDHLVGEVTGTLAGDVRARREVSITAYRHTKE